MSTPTLVPALRGWLADAAAVLAPVHCAGCGSPDRVLCPDCLWALRPRPHRLAPVFPGGPPVGVALDYGGVTAAVLGALKERDRIDLVAPLAPAMRAAIAAALGPGLGLEAPIGPARRPPGLLVVTIPSAPAAVRRRGFRPVDALVRRAGLRPTGHRMLALARAVDDQAGLSAEERAANLRGAMTASAALAGHPVLVADDVLTTGATLAEAQRAVAAAGGQVVAAACLAHTPRRFPKPGRPSGERKETERK